MPFTLRLADGTSYVVKHLDFLFWPILMTTVLGASVLSPLFAQDRTAVALGPRLDRGTRTDVYGDPLPPGVLARMGTLRDYIGEGSSRIIFSPDGRFVTATSAWFKPPLRLWDPQSGRVVRELKELDVKGMGVTHVAFSSDGKQIAAADSLGTVRLGSTDTGRKIRDFPGHDDILGIKFSPDGKILTVWQAGTAWFWDIATGTRTHWHSMTGDQPGTLPHFLEVWSLTRPRNVVGRAVGRKRWLVSSRFGNMIILSEISPDGKWAASMGSPGYRIWDVNSHRHVRSIPRHREPPGLITEYAENQFHFSPDGKLLAVGVTLSSLGLWDVATGTLYRRLSQCRHCRGIQLRTRQQTTGHGWGPFPLLGHRARRGDPPIPPAGGGSRRRVHARRQEPGHGGRRHVVSLGHFHRPTDSAVQGPAPIPRSHIPLE